MSKMEKIESLEAYASSLKYDDTLTPKSGPATASASKPVAPVVGDVWFNTTDSSMYVFGPTGFGASDWIQIGGSSK